MITEYIVEDFPITQSKLMQAQSTQTRFLLIFLILFSFCLGTQAAEKNSDKQIEIEKYLRAVNFMGPFKEGVRTEVARAGKSSPQLNFILNSNENTVIGIIATVLSHHFTLQQATTAAEFYESPTGRYITSMQRPNSTAVRTPMALNQQQAAAYKKFRDSGTEEFLNRSLNDRNIWGEIYSALNKASEK